jgi:hypothetical protein
MHTYIYRAGVSCCAAAGGAGGGASGASWGGGLGVACLTVCLAARVMLASEAGGGACRTTQPEPEL